MGDGEAQPREKYEKIISTEKKDVVGVGVVAPLCAVNGRDSSTRSIISCVNISSAGASWIKATFYVNYEWMRILGKTLACRPKRLIFVSLSLL